MTAHWDWTDEAEIKSRLGEHLPFLERTLEALAELGWDGRDYFGVQMVLEETLSNAIRHGNKCDETKRVRVACRASKERFWMTVEDEGEGFQPDKVADCTTEENLHAFGGRGMALIEAYMKSVAHNERGNQITVETERGYKPPADEE